MDGVAKGMRRHKIGLEFGNDLAPDILVWDRSAILIAFAGQIGALRSSSTHFGVGKTTYIF